jgi:hypothetical protein
VEILVAIAVLVIMISILAQIFGTISRVWIFGQGKVNNFTKARAMLNILETDFNAAVFRSDLPAFPGGTVEFYTARAGVPGAQTGSLRNISLISYALQTGATPENLPTVTLERTDMPVSWTDPATQIGFGDTAAFPPAGGAESFTPRDTAPGVVAFQALFVQANGSLSSTTFTPKFSASGSSNPNPTCAIGITLAVIDDQAMQHLNALQVTSLEKGFAGAVTGNESVKADWENYLNTGLAWNSYPKSLADGVGIYECYITVP